MKNEKQKINHKKNNKIIQNITIKNKNYFLINFIKKLICFII